MIPSLSDFGTHANSLYPHLWDRCFFAFAPGLGNSSNKAIDWATGTASVFTNFSAARWGYDSGIPYLEGGANDSTNTRARFNWQSSNNPTSLAAWVYWTGQATNAMPLTVGGTDAYLFIDAATSIPNFTVNNGNARATGVTAVAVNGWTHLCGVRNSSELRLYVNGVLDKTTAYPAGALNTGTAISVYSYQDGSVGSNYFAGRVDDAFAWSRPLSVEEIKLLSSQRNIAFVRKTRRTLLSAWPTEELVTGSGSATTNAATGSASGLQTFAGVGSALTGSSSASAAGLHSIVGSATASTAGCASSAVGGMQVVGQCAAPAGPAVSSASGSVGFVGSASPSTQSAASSAAGVVAVSGTALATTANAVSSAVGGSGLFGSAAIQLGDAVSQCAAVVASVGTGLGSTSCQSSASGFVSGTGAGLASTDNAQASALGFVGVVGSGLSSTDALSSAAGTVALVGLGLLTTGDAQSVAVGTIPVSGSAAVLLQSAYMVASSIAIQTDVELSAIIPVAELVAEISVPMLKATVRYDVLEGRKIWP